MMQNNKGYVTVVVDAAEDYSFAGRLSRLRKRKAEQTAWKRNNIPNMDEDDYGYVPPPEGVSFTPEYNDLANHTFYGADLWAKNFSGLLKMHPVYIDLNDALCGRWMFILQRLRPFESATSNNNMEMAPIFDYHWLKEDQKRYDLIPGIGKMHHFAPDYQIGLDLGWKGIREKIEHYRTLNLSEESQELYRAELKVLDGIDEWMAHACQSMEELKEKLPEGPVRDNLITMLNANKTIRSGPPETFLEACQWIAWANMLNRTYNRAGAGCQLDTILYPYYTADRKKGILTKEEAQFIIACLLLNDPTYYQIGGPDSETGEDLTNELSFVILEAAHSLKTTINLTIRYFDKLDKRLFYRGIQILIEDKQAYPRFSGDKALVEGFVRCGYTEQLARKRIAVGCNWMSLPGLEYTLNDLVKVNMAKVFEVAFYECAGSGKLTVRDIYSAFEKHLRRAVRCLKEGIDFHLANQYRNAPELMLNLLSHGPIEKGLDASHGGMTYYNIAIDGAGLAIVANSFAAMEQRIEKEKIISWEQCVAALKDNYQSEEGRYVREVMLSAGKYGHGGTLGDSWAVRVSALFTHLVFDEPTPEGRLTIPGLFSWANTVSFGKTVGATPDGRLAGDPINHGANPLPGFRKDGALSAMGDAIASVQCGCGNTAPWQLELDQSLVDNDQLLNNIAAVIETHFEKGGTLININIMDGKAILEAYEDPASHPDLVVRVTGFTAYFSALSPEFRKIIVERVITSA